MSDDQRAVVEQWLAAIAPSEGGTAVATAYLERHPDEASADRLVQLLLEQSIVSGAELRRVIQAEFDRSDTVPIRGWILSRTEARLAALRHLTR